MFSLHHVALSVTDLDASIAFYSTLHFQPVYHWQADDDSARIVHLKQGDLLLELFCFKNTSPAPLTSRDLASDLPRIGIKHFGLRVGDIHAALQQLQQLKLADNVQVMHGRTGIDYFFIKDPDGILLEIVQDDRQL
ncbi:glyoxalase/bleomycin resistance/dioxygenase family protein [Mariprofundus sp. EBB-1]|uniref:VOC family protein n=1 Tax=Mariprofundus sp. EBB-1 TaxID=2650971 RepID=UPI000EF1EC3B|nr:VOC family protein [Mariprofundus sp. EBB-1]RLL51067.1 glyoxalase/bleomycin resistance/dioxygenase family protein [Mariprofundus sp. EBB-1]